ncbi:TonB family protein [Thalassobium sp. R2A62]|uniref:TonB family protein n=1 Tax=Thalassobium sp. R2A62 TaxID=633131 RepID=UPI001CBFB7B4
MQAVHDAPQGGGAVIEVRIARDGSAAAIRVQRASGTAEFDQFALNAVRSVASFPPPPSGAPTPFRAEITGR